LSISSLRVEVGVVMVMRQLPAAVALALLVDLELARDYL
jgi:hypothetical protein